MIARAFIVLVLVLFSSAYAMAGEQGGGPKDVITVGGNSAYPPYEFLDKDGNPAGFVVELTRAIADAMGFKVRIRLGQSWTDMRKALEDGDVDVLQGISFSEDREKILDFSPPHSFVTHSIFARKGVPKVYTLDELEGKDVIVMGRGVMHDYFVQAGLQIQPVPAPTVADAIKLLATGAIRLCCCGNAPGNVYHQRSGDHERRDRRQSDSNQKILLRRQEGKHGGAREIQRRFRAHEAFGSVSAASGQVAGRCRHVLRSVEMAGDGTAGSSSLRSSSAWESRSPGRGPSISRWPSEQPPWSARSKSASMRLKISGSSSSN